MQHGAVGHDSGIASGAGDARFARGLRDIGKFVRLEMVIEELVLAENDGVVDGHRLEHHAVGVLHRGGCHDNKTRVVGINRLHALAVKGAGAERAAAGQSNDYGAGNVGAVVEGGGLIDDLVEPDGREVGELHFDDRARAFDGGTDGQADNGVLAQRRVHDTTGKFGGQILRCFERAAECANVLPVDENARVIGQRFFLRGADGFEVGDAHSSSAS